MYPELQAALQLMGYGFTLVFSSLVLLYGAIKLLAVIFKDKGDATDKE